MMPAQMKLLIIAATTGLTFACASNPTSTTSEAPASPVASPSPEAASAPAPEPPAAVASPEAGDHSAPTQGGQVVETGEYHLELLALPEGDQVHVDFWLLSGSDHASVTDATVTATVQFPNGTQKTVDMIYDPAGQHYKALVPGFVAGEYRVVVQTDRQGEKVNGRFTFKL